MNNRFLPLNHREMKERGWDQADIVLVSGDAYVDHPAFGIAVIGRALEYAGFRVAIIAQPDWHSKQPFQQFGRPRLYYGISAGNLDPMVAHYTPAGKKRRSDYYSPGGIAGLRPDQATVVYANRCREAFADVPIVIGGLEASLRRFSHYDYRRDKVKRSILLDSRADILVYGNGELQAVAIAQALAAGQPVQSLNNLPGTVVRVKDIPPTTIMLPAQSQVAADKAVFARAYRILALAGDQAVAQPVDHWYIFQNRRQVYTGADLDRVFSLPFTRQSYSGYNQPVPALATVRHSIQSHRGCFGGCSFCAIYFHEGKQVVSRSPDSIVAEASALTTMPEFHGTIDNIGGPTANMYGMTCRIGWCSSRVSCLFPDICPNLVTNHRPWIELLRRTRNLPAIRHVFVESGVRHDLLLQSGADEFREFCRYHISGQLKVAPEHASSRVLRYMHKPDYRLYREFAQRYRQVQTELGKKQYLVPYFISAHPGCTIDDMIILAQEIKKLGHFPEQVQDFTPTPMTLSSCMFYTGIEPLTSQKIPVATTVAEKNMQRALLHYADRANADLVYQALKKAGRLDLVGTGNKCLLPESWLLPGAKGAEKKSRQKRRDFSR